MDQQPLGCGTSLTTPAHKPAILTLLSARELGEMIDRRGKPCMIVSENGTEFVSRDLDLWTCTKRVTLDFSRPGKPTDNAFVEAFNSRVRAECMNAHWFLTLADAREKLEAWRGYYNEERPHGAIGNKVPFSLQKAGGAASPSP
jgi:putative transposase